MMHVQILQKPRSFEKGVHILENMNENTLYQSK